jgi:hypothetical protein
MIRATLFLLAALPLAAAPILGPELPLTPRALGTPIGSQFGPYIASNGDGFLLVWEDRRADEKVSVWAVRITADGEPLDEQPLLLMHDAILWNGAHVYWNGSEYIVQDLHSRATEEDFKASVTTGGKVTVWKKDAPFARIWPRDESGTTLAVVPDRGITSVYFIEPDGRQAPDFIDIRTPPGATLPALHAASLGKGEWVLVLGNFIEAHWVRIRRGEGVLESRYLGASPHAGLVTAASGASAAATFTSLRQINFDGSERTFERVMYWSAVDSDGTLYSGTLPADTAYGSADSVPEAMVNGDTFYFAYTRHDVKKKELRVVRVMGGRVEETTIEGPATTAWYASALGTSGARNMVAWAQPCGLVESCRIAYRVFDRDAMPDSAPTRYAGAEYVVRQELPSAANGPSSSMVAWLENDAGTLIRARVTPAGAAPSMLTVAEIDYGRREVPYLRTAVNGDTFAVVWMEAERDAAARHIMARRFTAAGVPIDGAPVRLSSEEYGGALSVAPRGGAFQVVWTGYRGVVATAALPLSGPPAKAVWIAQEKRDGYRYFAAIAAAGDGAVVMWVEDDPNSSGSRAMAVRFSPDGLASSPVPVAGGLRVGPYADLASNDRELVFVTATNAVDRCLRVDRFDFALTRIADERVFCDRRGLDRGGVPFWDGGRWWLAPRGAHGATLPLAAFDRDWREVASYEIGENAQNPAFVQAATGPAIVYQRNDAGASNVLRLFTRSLLETDRRRSVR